MFKQEVTSLEKEETNTGEYMVIIHTKKYNREKQKLEEDS
jgi:hypothetical protein